MDAYDAMCAKICTQRADAGKIEKNKANTAMKKRGKVVTAVAAAAAAAAVVVAATIHCAREYNQNEFCILDV